MRAKNFGVLFLILALTTTGMPSAFAAETPITKLSRGLINIVTSPLEFAIQYMELEDDHNTAVALVGGIFNGVFFTAARILGGAYEVISFPIPVPDGYEPLMEPATPIDALVAIEGAERV